MGVGVVLPSDPDGLEADVHALVDEHVARIRNNPTSGAAHGELGLVYEGNKLWDEAVRSFERAEQVVGW